MRFKIKIIYIICYVIILQNVGCFRYGTSNITDFQVRQKRYLVYPFGGGLFKLIMGFGVPVAVRKDWSLGFGYNMQFQYALPPNIGGLFNLYNPVTYAIEYRKRRSVKEQRDTSREYFYLFIETLLEMRGMHGKSCLLRMICEEAEAPVGHDGIMGEILHIILTPQENPGPVNKNLIEYSEARHAGHARADCRNLYPDCPPDQNMLDAISSAFHY